MSNEELVQAIQAGARDRLPELWEQVEKYAAQQAGRTARALNGFGGVTVEDLYQSGYLALVDAVEGYDAERGMSFVGYYAMYLKSAFATAAGYRGQKRDPLNNSASLDMPLGEDTDGDTLMDIQPDPVDPIADEEARIWREQLHEALGAAIGALPREQADTLHRRFYQGQTLKEVSREVGVGPERVRQREAKALRTLRQPRISQSLRQFIEERTPYWARVGPTAFNSTGTSVVELAVLRREALEART